MYFLLFISLTFTIYLFLLTYMYISPQWDLYRFRIHRQGRKLCLWSWLVATLLMTLSFQTPPLEAPTPCLLSCINHPLCSISEHLTPTQKPQSCPTCFLHHIPTITQSLSVKELCFFSAAVHSKWIVGFLFAQNLTPSYPHLRMHSTGHRFP